MAKKTKKKAVRKKAIRKKMRLKEPEIFEAFAAWIALPKTLRQPRTQGEFAKKHGINECTLPGWKLRDDFWGRVITLRHGWGRERSGDVVARLYNQIMRRKNPDAALFRIWMEMFSDLSTRIQITGHLKTTPTLENLTDAELDKFIAKKAKVLKALNYPLAAG